MTEVDTSVHVLSNGSYSVLLTGRGGGVSSLNGYALTRWLPDPVLDAHGIFFFVRDLESGAYWSLGEAPAPAQATGGARVGQGQVVMWSSCVGIEAACTVVVAADRNTESRHVRIRNHSERARRIELTSFAELALNTLAADAAHPAFSKLFVETAYDREHAALMAWRRLRSPQDQPLWVAQKLIGADAWEFETDRMRFVGRRRSVADAIALVSKDRLSGTVGAVLDPVFALRTTIVVPAGAEAAVELITCAAESREAVADLLELGGSEHAEIVARANGGGMAALGLPASWQAHITADLESRDWRGSTAHERIELPVKQDYGHFSDDGTEYIIPVADNTTATPQPWINVLANEQFGCLLSENGAGYTWAVNSRENRLTPWSNDAVSDERSERVYLVDTDTDELWSVFDAPCEVAHGFGYSRFTRQSHGLHQSTLVFVPRNDPVKCVQVTLTNYGTRSRQMRFTGYAQLVLGTVPAETRGSVNTQQRGGVIYATNDARGEFCDRVAFAGAIASIEIGARAATGSRASALRQPRQLDGRFGDELDACAALSFDFMLAAGESVQCVFLLGEAENQQSAQACVARFQTVQQVSAAFDETVAFWRELLATVHVTTPVPALDRMVNGWLTYQNLACRMWARSAFYQSGGAFGFRDQLQDSAALLYYDAAITRRQILLHAAHQFVEGDVLHWWHPPLSKGIRTRFSDDLLWLPYITLFYLDRTNDWSILDETVRYISAPQLEDGEDEMFVVPQHAGKVDSLYEHCCKTLDRSLTRGPHDLPLIGVGDWNDGMNRVGREGRGESVWLGFFLFEILDDFIPVCETRQDFGRVHRYSEYMLELAHALNDAGWDGAWYRRAYYDNGQPLGSAQNDECRIDALAQAWAVLSGAASPERAAQAIAEMQRQLVCEKDGIIRLLTPAFDKTPNDPGYIKGYIPGVRENGGQYTHAATWVVRALAELGRREDAARLAELLSPVTHGAADNVARYCGEPYVIAADIYGEPPHVGRAGWTWYTGSAGWYQRVLLESILGFKLDGGDVVRLQPCIPRAWPGFTLRYRFPSGTTYVFNVKNTSGGSRTSEGNVEDNAVIVPIMHDGRTHEVNIEAGDDVVPRYHARVDQSVAPLLRMTSL